MSQITKIEKQSKNKDRVNIFLDGEFCLGCSVELMVKFNLKENKEISEHELEQLVFENEKSLALKKLLSCLVKT